MDDGSAFASPCGTGARMTDSSRLADRTGISRSGHPAPKFIERKEGGKGSKPNQPDHTLPDSVSRSPNNHHLLPSPLPFYPFKHKSHAARRGRFRIRGTSACLPSSSVQGVRRKARRTWGRQLIRFPFPSLSPFPFPLSLFLTRLSQQSEDDTGSEGEEGAPSGGPGLSALYVRSSLTFKLLLSRRRRGGGEDGQLTDDLCLSSAFSVPQGEEFESGDEEESDEEYDTNPAGGPERADYDSDQDQDSGEEEEDVPVRSLPFFLFSSSQPTLG